MNEFYVYVFVRQDIPLAQQIVQSNHAVLSMATLAWPHPEVIPNIIVIGVPDTAALERVQAKLRANAVQHFAWREPDYDFGFTAIATGILSNEQRQVLAKYRLWNECNYRGVEVEQSALQGNA